MALSLYNSLTQVKENFIPIDTEGHVGLYTCGPTVYNFPHIGNYRAYLFADILKRTLLYSGYKVNHVMNITDIDDKTIRDSQKEGKSLKEFTEFYTNEFYKDRDALNIVPADIYPKATDYIQEMVDIIEKLIEKGFAYKSEDGSVYFDIKKDNEYGKLAHLDMESLKSNASGRIKNDEYEKDNVQDFALWKAWDAADGDVFWETSLGKGRPGWHIECSAMSIKNLGEYFDIHTGGRDNMFPHHENEIAQSECSTGHKFVNIWMHNEWLLVDGKKMAKSANNFYTLRDVIEKGYDPLVFRYLNLLNHYKTPLNFTWESLDAAQAALNKLQKSVKNLGEEMGIIDEKYEKEFAEAINNDLGIPKALGIAWTMMKDKEVSNADKKTTMLSFDKIFGLGLDRV
jgi:cysteinyl-tRNA synthetase